MTGGEKPVRDWTFHPLTIDRWEDFESLFGPRGGCGGCWCMWFRLRTKDYRAAQGEKNRMAMKALVESGQMPGILAYAGAEPVGWCALAPRKDYVRLGNSRILAPVDEKPVWSVVCFFVAKAHRKRGLTPALLRAAPDFAASRGAEILEGYPHEVPEGPTSAAFIYTGVVSAFEKAGFREVARRSPKRPIMRRNVQGARG